MTNGAVTFEEGGVVDFLFTRRVSDSKRGE